MEFLSFKAGANGRARFRGARLHGRFVGIVTLRAGQDDPLKKPLGPIYTLLQNKYYFDELYDLIFVKPAVWFSEVFSYKWMDRGAIDGILHVVARISYALGGAFRNYIDVPIINGSGDFVGESVKKLGKAMRVIQTG